MIRHLSYGDFDEYKVMGLAPYGDPATYRELFRTLYSLGKGGDYAIHPDRYPALAPLRRRGEPFDRRHQDWAAALQESLEEIAFHFLGHYRRETGHSRLTLAGGVALNCTLNGKLLASGLFDEIFVQPASHDAGCALGAALHLHLEERRPAPRALEHVFWGTDVGPGEDLARELERWREVVTFQRLDDVVETAAGLLADGAAIAWVQGRSEFGPRALGHRSILADPRPAANRERVNRMIKKREGYRPFAPSVLEEDLHAFFEVPAEVRKLPYMLFVVQVRAEKRSVLGAITHVDGSARVQTVSRADNELYWRLIAAFKELTGIPILLNTSFNNHVEPIVDSVEDAIVCYLTTGLDHLVVGDYLVTRRERRAFLDLVPSLPRHLELRRSPSPREAYELWNVSLGRSEGEIPRTVFEALQAANGGESLADLIGDDDEGTVERLWELWEGRRLRLRPRAGVGAP